MASTPVHHASPAASHTHGFHTPSHTSQQPHASELDTTMEDDDEEEQPQTQSTTHDDLFSFNAPSYYDLKHPEREQQYVNNADGYFYSSPLPPAPPAPPAVLQTPQRPPPSSSSSSVDRNGRTPQTPFGMYREPQADVPSEEEEDQEMDQHDDGHDQQQRHTEEDDDRMSDGGESDGTLDLEALATTGSGPASAPPARSSASSSAALPPPPRSLGHSHSFNASSSSSSLLQPTQAYLLRLQAEQAARERHHQATQGEHSSSSSSFHSHTTQGKAPLLRTSQRTHSADHLRLSSTSREIQKIQEEKTRMQLETMKVREFHERVRKQRVPPNVHQRSTKQLTIPQSPYLEVGHRGESRRRQQLNQSMSSSDDGSNTAVEEPHAFLAPEQFLSRDYEFPATQHKHGGANHTNGNGHQEVTVPHTPQLRTSERAAARRNVFPDEAMDAEEHKPDYSKMKVNGVTRPLTPQFETDRRAAQSAAYRKPIEVVDKDAEELNRKFHARPVPRRVLEAPKLKSSPQKTRPSLTKPVSPKLATSARARSIFPEEEPEEKKPSAPRRTGPTIPETPPLRSLQRHNMYQENMRRRQEAEEEEMRKQREFKAQPIRLTTTPPRFEGSKKPLTEVQPFDLRGDRLHERAQERLERLRREEEERLRAAQQFRAMPMPVVSDEDMAAGGHHHHAAPARPLTKPSSPKFATNRRATERAAFEAAERERRAREEEQKRQMEEERRRQEEEEIKRMRRDELVFHARPVPGSKAFELKANTRPLTEPESPYLQTKIRGGASSSTTAA